MYIDFTKRELEQLEKLKQKFADKLNNTQDQKERSVILLQFQTERDDFIEKCELKRFKKLGNDPEAILADAKEQLSKLINYDYLDLTSGITPEDVQTLNIGTVKDGKIFFYSDFVSTILQEELKLHFEALKDDPEHKQQLIALIVATLEGSEKVINDTPEGLGRNNKPLEIVQYKRSPLSDLKNYNFMNDKAVAELMLDMGVFQEEANGQMRLLYHVEQTPRSIKEKAKREKKDLPAEQQVYTYISLLYTGTDADADIASRKLTSFDKSVYEAIANRYADWIRENPNTYLRITPQEIWRTMKGKKSGDGDVNPSQKQIQKLRRSIDKMACIRFEMDITEEIEKLGLHFEDERLTGGYIKDNFLIASEGKFTTEKGREYDAFIIKQEPILYTYNRQKQSIVKVPYEMLDVSSHISDGDNVIEFKNYLLLQIQLIKNAKEDKDNKKGYFKRSDIILLDTIYKSTGIPTPEERVKDTYANEKTRKKEIGRKRQEDCEKIESMLEAWKAKGYIKGYVALNQDNEPLKEKQRPKGYKILV